MTFGLPCITAVSDKATRKSSAQKRPLAMTTQGCFGVLHKTSPDPGLCRSGPSLQSGHQAFAPVAATTADGTITPASSPPQSPRSSSAAFLQRPPALSEKGRSAPEIPERAVFLRGDALRGG